MCFKPKLVSNQSNCYRQNGKKKKKKIRGPPPSLIQQCLSEYIQIHQMQSDEWQQAAFMFGGKIYTAAYWNYESIHYPAGTQAALRTLINWAYLWPRCLKSEAKGHWD